MDWGLVLLVIVVVPIILTLKWVEGRVTSSVFRDVRKAALKGWIVPARRVIPGKEDCFEVFHERWISRFAAALLVLLALAAMIPWPIENLNGHRDPWEDPVRVTATVIFVLWAIGILMTKDRKLVVQDAQLSHHKPFAGVSTFELTELTELRPIEGAFVIGFDLVFRDGRVLRVGNSMMGLLDLLQHLTHFHADARVALAEVRRALAERT